MEDFHRGPYETAVGDGEMLTEIRIPVRPGGSSAYAKVERRAGDWAVTSAGAAVWMDGGAITDARVGLAAVGPNTTGIPAISEALRGQAPSEEPLRAGRRDRRRELLAGHRQPRHRRLQAAPRRRADPPHAARCRRTDRGRPRTATREGTADMQVTMTVNGESVTREIEGRLLLVHFLRDELGLTGTHWGCDTSNCGTCVVWLDGEPVKTCTVLAAMAGGHEVRTVEGLESDGVLDPVQEGFMQCHGLQCGFCTPGHADDRPGPAGPRPGPRARTRSARRSPARSAAAPATPPSSGRSSGPPPTTAPSAADRAETVGSAS